jgi:putative nucleotidyltransferase with HDIG domain
MRIPTREECLQMLKENNVPRNIIEHSKAVADIAVELGRKLKSHGEDINLQLLEAGALLHDICKHECIGRGHEAEIAHGDMGADFLRKKGLPEIAEMARTHMMGAVLTPRMLDTWEKKLVFYADKRVNHDKRVTIDERFDYIEKRYPKEKGVFVKAKHIVKKMEKEIFEKAGVRI